MNLEELRTKRIGILGFSKNNHEVTAWLLRHGAEHVTVLDEGAVEWRAGQQNDSPSTDPSLHGAKWKFSPDAFANLPDYDVLIRTPGVRLSRPEIQAAKAAGVEISSQTKLFFEYCPALIIGVTGTKGKGTTCSLIAAMQEANTGLSGKAYLAGNIGLDPFAFLDQLTAEDRVILELSSFQLQDLDRSPHVAVVLGITSDHLDYHANRGEYVDAKTAIVRFQRESDFAVVNADSPSSASFAQITKGQVWETSSTREVDRGAFVRWTGSEPNVRTGEVVLRSAGGQDVVLVRTTELQLRGEHNLENVMAAAVGAHLSGVPIPTIQSVLRTFAGYKHRLQKVGEVNGVVCYEDSAATAPEPAIAAVKSFNEPIHLIVGGSSKGWDFSEFGQVIAESTVASVIPLGTAEAPKIVAAVEASRKGESPIITDTANSMDEAFQAALNLAKPGDVILLSPAAPGFDLFKNYADRGDQFIACVKQAEAKHVA